MILKIGKQKKVALEDDYNITYIEGIVTDDKGTDYAVFIFFAINYIKPIDIVGNEMYTSNMLKTRQVVE